MRLIGIAIVTTVIKTAFLADDSYDEIWPDSQCGNLGWGPGTGDLEACKGACRMKLDCTAVNFCSNDCVLRACKNPIPVPNWSYRADCKGHTVGSELPDHIKQDYLALQIDGSKEYFEKVKTFLPQLLAADALKDGEVGIALVRSEKDPKYPYLALRTGEGIETQRPKEQVITVNGTVTKKVGKRPYSDAKFRPTGLFAAPGDIITITIPKSLVGKIGATIGQDEAVKISFTYLNKVVNKIASPFGGLIIVRLTDIDATTKEGMFEVKIDNAVKAPFFSLGLNSNEEWNKMKMLSPPYTVLRIPGQIHVYMPSHYLQPITDMVTRMNNWKDTMDILDDLVGVPRNLQPGEEQLHYDPTVGGGYRVNICTGGGRSALDSTCSNNWVENKNTKIVFHEFGHGYCYADLPFMGEQWYAELVREYMERKRGFVSNRYGGKFFEFPFSVMHQMVSFSKFSKGEACGVAKFPGGTDFNKTSYYYDDYINCWTTLYRLPLWEFGFDVLKEVNSLDAVSTISYRSKNDRMADLYCKVTKRNLIPMFEFYNINISTSVADQCQKQEAPVMITNYIKTANCIMNKDIMECASMPEFPPYKGICRLSGICNKHPDFENKQVKLDEEFDLWGGTTSEFHKKGMRDTTRNEKNCHGRAQETFKWCGNEMDQKITASFTLKNGDSSSETFPPSGNCYNDWPRQLPHYAGDSRSMTPEKCNDMCDKKSFQYFGVQYYSECWCGDDMPSSDKLKPLAECDLPCSGDSSRTCGGGYRNNAWKVCKGDDCKFNYV